jgi:hypothetical protein
MYHLVLRLAQVRVLLDGGCCLTTVTGIFMLQIPRQVPIVLLASGSRVEVLTRCKAPAGTTYILSATNNPDPFNPNNVASFATDANRVVQPSVATITITVSTCSRLAIS